MKKIDILTIVTIAVLAGGCNSKEEMRQKDPMPIQLTATVGVEALTRGADGNLMQSDTIKTRGIQETVLTNGEKVYVWAKQTSTWDYLKAWNLTAGSAGSLSGSSQYYPLDGTAITMSAVHGNFSEILTEGSTNIGTLTHNVETNQSATGDYEKSDLLFGTATGSDADASKNIPFTHKLSKIEVNLTPGSGYVASDLNAAVVHLNNVKPTITIDPTDGTLGAASNSATITPRKIDGTNNFEAVIPPQTLSAADATTFVSVTLDGVESSARNTVTTFNENTKYVYNVTVSVFDPGIPLSTVTAAHLGKVIAANGKVYDTKAIADVHSEGVAMIGHITSTGHGYALSLWNEGYGNKAAAILAAGTNYTKSKPAGTTWSLPTVYQWCYIFASCGGTAYGTDVTCLKVNYSCGNLRTMMVACGGEDFVGVPNSGFYWSSTTCPNETTVSHDYCFLGADPTRPTTAYWCGASDSGNCGIRPCLTF